MPGTIKKISGPAYLANAAANIYTPPASTIQTNIRHIHLANKTAGAITVSLYVGATGGSAGGTEIMGGRSIPANTEVDMYFNPALVLQSTDFLTGVASAASSVTITVIGEQSVV
jgi:hypothetical protein